GAVTGGVYLLAAPMLAGGAGVFPVCAGEGGAVVAARSAARVPAAGIVLAGGLGFCGAAPARAGPLGVGAGGGGAPGGGAAGGGVRLAVGGGDWEGRAGRSGFMP